MNILNKEKTGEKKSQKFLIILFFVLLLSWTYISFSGGSNSPVSEDKYPAGKYSTSVYFNQVVSIYEDVTEAVVAIDYLESYMKYWSNSDVVEITKQTLIIENSYAKINNIVPPNDLISIHQEVLQAFGLLRDSMPIYRKAIDSRNSQLRTQSMNMILKASDDIDMIVNKFE